MSFKSLNRDCPVCQGARRDCRENRENSIVHCRASLDVVPVGWRYIKDDRQGFGMFAPDDGSGENADWTERRQKQDEARRLEKLEFERKVMPVAERDRHYRRLLSELGSSLHPVDQADLDRRGITAEQAKRWGIRSVEEWQRLISEFPINLPGIGNGGKKLWNGYPGYIVPTRDPAGTITSLGQVRNQNHQADGKKYPWITGHSQAGKNPGGMAAHLPSHEMPLQVMQPAQPGQYQGYIGLCEGVGVKPGIAADRLGCPVIGASGANFASSPETLKQYIQDLSCSLHDDESALSPERCGKLSLSKSESINSTQTKRDANSTPITTLTSLDTTNPKSSPHGAELRANSHCGQSAVAAAGQSTSPQREKRIKGLILLPDCDSGVSNSKVVGQYIKAAEIAAEMGLTVQVLWWSQVTKADGDIDEVDPAALAQSKLISWTEFLAIAQEHGGLEKPKHRTALSEVSEIDELERRRAWGRSKAAQEKRNWYETVARLAGTTIVGDEEKDRMAIARAFARKQRLEPNHVEGYFEPLTMPKDDRHLFILDGQKGTRKTSVAIASAVSQSDSGVMLCPTRLLCEQTSAELGIPYLRGSKEGWGGTGWVVLPPESLWKIADYRPQVLAIDEANEIIKRVQSGDLGNHPGQCREAFKRMLSQSQHAIAANDTFYRPTAKAIARIGSFAPDQTTTIQRKRAPTEMTIYLYEDTATGDGTRWDGLDAKPEVNDLYHTWLGSLVEYVGGAQRVSIPCGSQEKLREIGRVQRHFYPDKRGAIFDGQDSFQKRKEEFARSPMPWLDAHQPQWLGYSPVFNSGLSGDGEYFDVQFEYATPRESASSASQRGERMRDAIHGKRMSSRHVYLSMRGMAAMPDPALFTADYWRADLEGTVADKYDVPAGIAQQFGAADLLDQARDREIQSLVDVAELAELKAINAVEVYFKKEFLIMEWQDNGWTIETVGIDPELARSVSPVLAEIKEGILTQQGRTISLCPHFANVVETDDPKGPIHALRIRKKRVAQQTGENYPGLFDPEWMTAYVCEHGGHLGKARLQALVKLGRTKPEIWEEINYWQAMKTLGGILPIGTKAPELPVTAKEIDMVNLIIGCPGVDDLLSGSLTEWTKDSPQVKDAAAYLRKHAPKFARLTSTNQRIRGYQFTASVADVQCWHKLIALMGMGGCEVGREGRGNRIYALKTPEWHEQNLARQHSPRRARDLYRAEQSSQVVETLQGVITSNHDRLAPAWADYAHLIRTHVNPRLSVIDNPFTEPLDPLGISDTAPMWITQSDGTRQLIQMPRGAISALCYPIAQ